MSAVKFLIVAMASGSILGTPAVAQSTSSGQPAKSQQNSPSGSANLPKNPGSATTGTGQAGGNDNRLGKGARTGTVVPNSTGSSGTSGTTGVDSSTSNSH